MSPRFLERLRRRFVALRHRQQHLLYAILGAPPYVSSTSANGRYDLHMRARELRGVGWSVRPRLLDIATNTVLFQCKDPRWLLEEACWESDTTLTVALAKHERDIPVVLTATIDCAALAATIGDNAPCPLDRLEQALEMALDDAVDKHRRNDARFAPRTLPWQRQRVNF